MRSESRALPLPCPFCGSTWGNGLTVGYKGQPSTSWHVYCIKCKTMGPNAEGAHADTANDAIALWNKRAEGSENAPASEEVRKWAVARKDFYEAAATATVLRGNPPIEYLVALKLLGERPR